VADTARDRITRFFQKNVANRVMRRMPFQTLLETTGRKSGEPRRTPVGGRRVGDSFWFVSEFGEKSHYVRNIMADPRVRGRINADQRALAPRHGTPAARRRHRSAPA